MTDSWDSAYARQTESLRGQLAQFRALPNRLKRRCRLLEYICAACQGTILEVLPTTPRVVMGTKTGVTEGKYPTSEEREAFIRDLGRRPGVADWQDFHRRTVDWEAADDIRPDISGPGFHAIPDDFEMNPPRTNGRLVYVCKCHQWDLDEALVASDLRAKRRKRSLDPQRGRAASSDAF